MESRRGQTCVVIGRGPSLDQWIDFGMPKLGNAIMGINHVGGMIDCEFNVSRHYCQAFSKTKGEWFIPMIHNWEYVPYASSKFLTKEIGYAHHVIPIHDSQFIPSREQMQRYRLALVTGGSASLAVEIAWYLGFDKLVFIGCDGGSQTSERLPNATEVNYNDSLAKLLASSERRFGKNYEFWKSPLAKKETGQ